MAWEYSEKTKQLFLDAVHGKPGTHLGEIENPDGLGEHGSIACGDSMRFTFRVNRHPTDPSQDVITEAKYLTFGCTSAIAASEALCYLIEGKGMTPIQAIQITNDDIIEFLGGLPEQKIHCSVMGAEALEAAVFNWSQRRGVRLDEYGIDIHTTDQEEGRIVCKCFTLSEPYLRRKIVELNLRTIEEITGAVKAGGACMSCHHAPGGLQDILDSVWNSSQTASSTDSIGETVGESNKNSVSSTAGSLPLLPMAGSGPSGSTVRGAAGFTPVTVAPLSEEELRNLTPFQYSKRVEKMLEEFIRPVIREDGGDIEVIDIKGSVVYVQLQGACAGCAGAGQTLRYLVERVLKEKMDPNIRIVQV